MTYEELDFLIAEKVMGWTKINYGDADCWGAGDDPSDAEIYVQELVASWQPTRDIAQAWQVVQHIKQQRMGPANNYPNFGVLDESTPKRGFVWAYFAPWVNDTQYGGVNEINRAESYSSTLPRAICFAALRLMGVLEPAANGVMD